MKRLLAPIVLLCLPSCAEEETPTILQGGRGACGSVVEGVVPTQVTCPAECPIPVKAFRVRDTGTCERSANQYVACVNVAGSGANPGAAVLDTPDGPLFVDDPAFDCTNGAEGCVTVDTATRDRWTTCTDSDEEGCACACEGGECPFDRFVAVIDGCGLPSPCEPITADASPSVEQLQCYMDHLADGGPIKVEFDVAARHHVTNQLVTSRRVLAVSGFDVVRLDSVAFDRPSARCDLQSSSFFLGCDPEDPIEINYENEDGLIERVACTNPIAWVVDCDAEDPVCPGGA